MKKVLIFKNDRIGDLFTSTKALERTDLTGTFHQKIGSVSTTTVDQVQFSNINWSMTVLPEVS